MPTDAELKLQAKYEALRKAKVTLCAAATLVPWCEVRLRPRSILRDHRQPSLAACCQCHTFGRRNVRRGCL